jgi:N-acetylglutamate synthase-like GNAT family acetyltransferase
MMRRCLGESLIPVFSSVDRTAQSAIGDGYWFVFSGINNLSANLSLICRSDSKVFSEVIQTIESFAAPKLLFLAGDARSKHPGSRWIPAGTLPFMSKNLSLGSFSPDAKARTAGPEDFAAILTLLTKSGGIDQEFAELVVSATKHEQAGLRFWLYEIDGELISVVLSSIVEDVICLSAMATATQSRRRGYASNLLSAVLSNAKSEGIHLALLLPTEEGKFLYDAAGWETVEDWSVYRDTGSFY